MGLMLRLNCGGYIRLPPSVSRQLACNQGLRQCCLNLACKSLHAVVRDSFDINTCDQNQHIEPSCLLSDLVDKLLFFRMA